MKKILALSLVFLLNAGIYGQDGAILIAHNNYLVGATKSGKWLKDTEFPVGLSKTTKFYAFNPFEKTRPAEVFGTYDETGCGAKFFYFSNSDKTPENVFAEDSLKPMLALGTGAKWNPTPRTARKLAAADKTFQKIALDYLKTKKIIVRTIKLENVYAIDLENDGSEEIFLEASTYLNKEGNFHREARAGDYSFVLMRKIIGGQPKNFLIEGEFHPGRKAALDYLSEYDLSAFADLNGDGKIEVILDGTYSYAGLSTEVYESNKNKLDKVLSFECGD